MKILPIVLVLITLCSLGCSEKAPTGVASYSSWVKGLDRPWVSQKKVGGYEFTVFAEPPVFAALQSLKKANLPLGKTSMDSVLDAGRGYLQILIKVSSADKKTPILRQDVHSQQAYQSKVYYFSYELQSKLFLLNDDKRIPCELYHFERSYDLAPFVMLNCLFKVDPQDFDADLTFLLEDEHLGTGPIKIGLDVSSFNHPHNLKI